MFIFHIFFAFLYAIFVLVIFDRSLSKVVSGGGFLPSVLFGIFLVCLGDYFGFFFFVKTQTTKLLSRIVSFSSSLTKNIFEV